MTRHQFGSTLSSSMKFSTIEELKIEVESKIAENSKKCNKHGELRIQCSRIGIQRTRVKRSGNAGMLRRGDLDKLDQMYAIARQNFHNEPCTCFSN